MSQAKAIYHQDPESRSKILDIIARDQDGRVSLGENGGVLVTRCRLVEQRVVGSATEIKAAAKPAAAEKAAAETTEDEKAAASKPAIK